MVNISRNRRCCNWLDYPGTDIAMLFLGLLYVISTAVHGEAVSYVVLSDILPYVLLYAVVRFISCIYDSSLSLLIYIALCLFTIYESSLGLLQVTGIELSRHSAFPMTGSFFNPGPFGGFVAVGMSAALVHILRNKKLLFEKIKFHNHIFAYIILWLSCATVILSLLVLPASMSRAGWVGLLTALSVYLFRETQALEWIKSYKWLSLVICLMCVVVLIGTFMIKRDSAFGRLHIWDIEARVIMSSPIIGDGPGLAMGAYGQAQKTYFETDGRPAARTNIAGCPEYAFNEYLKIGMETGVAGMLLSVLLVLLAIASHLKKGSVLGYAMIAFSVFAFFSYPLKIPVMAVFAVLFVASSGKQEKSVGGIVCRSLVTVVLFVLWVMNMPEYKSRKEAAEKYNSANILVGMELYEDAIEDFALLYGNLLQNSRYLYDYGYSLFKTEQYEASMAVLSQGAQISSDPMFHNIIGRCYEKLGNFIKAEDEYLVAHNMVPCRLYPLVLLMDMYVSVDRIDDAIKIGEKILEMPINEKSRTMAQMRLETEEKLDNLVRR
jgi:hypothetical protein